MRERKIADGKIAGGTVEGSTRAWECCALAKQIVALLVILGAAAMAETMSIRSAQSASPQQLRSSVWHAVLAALHADGVRDELLPTPDEIERPAGLDLFEDTNLEVSSYCWNEGASRVELQMQCRGASRCLPFLVYVRETVRASRAVTTTWRENAKEGVSRALDRRPPQVCHAGFGVQAARDPDNVSARTTRGRAAKFATAPPTIRAGDKATALFSSTGLHMSANVTCLDRGVVGEVVRVRNQNGQIFRARITGPRRLEVLL